MLGLQISYLWEFTLTKKLINRKSGLDQWIVNFSPPCLVVSKQLNLSNWICREKGTEQLNVYNKIHNSLHIIGAPTQVVWKWDRWDFQKRTFSWATNHMNLWLFYAEDLLVPQKGKEWSNKVQSHIASFKNLITIWIGNSIFFASLKNLKFIDISLLYRYFSGTGEAFWVV